MNYVINDKIFTDGGEYTVIAIIRFEGSCDNSINLYVGRHADGHCDLIATDNASNWIVGDEDDAQHNYDHFDLLGDRVDIDAIRAVDAALADWIAERQEAAEKTILVARTEDDCYQNWWYVVAAVDPCRDMRDVIEDIWEDIPVDGYIRRGIGDDAEIWHFFAATDDLPGRAEWDGEGYPDYCAAPWDAEEKDDADCGNWGYYTDDGKRII